MKTIVTTVSLVLVSTILAFAVGELLLRQFYKFPQPQFLVIDPIVGHRFRPGIEGWFSREGNGHVRINSAGLRDKEYSIERDNSKKRMVVLGDSYTAALQVDIDETYHGLLEVEYGEQLEVLNFGVSGYGTAQELLTYKHYARKFQPDIVVLAFLPGNDIADNDKQLSNGYPRPYYTLGSGGLELDNAFRTSAKHIRKDLFYQIYYALTDNSIIFSLLDQLRYKTSVAPLLHGKDGEEVDNQGASDLIYAPSSDKHKEAWQLTERLLVKLSEEIEADGAVFVLLVLDSMPSQLTTQHNPYYVEQRIGDLCVRQHMICGFMAKPAMSYYERTGDPLHGFDGSNSGHWNQIGHQVAYQVLRETLLDNELIR